MRKRKRKPWSDKRWRVKSVGGWVEEWSSWEETARLSGLTVNGWVRLWLNEAVLLERVHAKEREEAG